MKNLIFLACALCAVQAVPLPAEQPNELEILQIPLQGNKELDIVSLADDDGKINDRNKRTIGILRELFPELSKIVEQKIQMLIPIVLRTVGPIFLRSGLGGLGGAGNNKAPSFDDDDEDDDDNEDDKVSKDENTISGANGRKVSISLPTFPPDDDDDDDDENEEEIEDIKKQSQSANDQGTSSTFSLPTIVSASTPGTLNPNIDLSVFDPEPTSSTTSKAVPESSNDDESQDNTVAIVDKIDLRQNDGESLGSAPYIYELPPYKSISENETKNDEFNAVASNGESTLDMAALNEKLETINRVVRQTAALQQTEGEKLEVAASDSQRVESKAPAIDELSLDNEETDDNRNKRFLSFGFGGSGGSGGGSGNFLFDIIRRTADRAARTAGTVYRVVAGTETLGLEDDSGGQKTAHLHQDHQQASDKTSRTETDGLSNGLVSGSTGTEHSDEKDNAADDGDAGKSADGYTEGIPGPVTRLFVLANRGLANLVQDLILRIAQTSERVVNFKARLITSLI
ncbi:hypothetical protein Bhyg_13035 [Pseudolycoriella hygida]|uniref:Uncharacterized protein n=1 Tax=Pseudolycoriella hygida TaxID=35572 RepID=A0A9Q0MYI8_9DIPT|nr:hypothetical protein Bhyg_13035 [Pseudolycoriella hygida]